MANKKSKNVFLVIMGVLIIAEIIIRIATIEKNTVVAILHLISLVFTGIYGFWLYKKPHGNMLKYAMLLFALANVLNGSIFLIKGYKFEIVRVVLAAAVCYCAGRLNRIDQNKYLMSIIGLGFLAFSIYGVWLSLSSGSVNVLSILKKFTYTINYCTLMIAYFVRYSEHKEAGITDAPKK